MATKQFIFIDDSGDPGFKFDRGSSRFFVIACLVFRNRDTIKSANNEIDTLRHLLNWSESYEFKFHRTNDVENKLFFSVVQKLEFEIWATVVDKQKIQKPGLKKRNSFYQKIIVDTLSKVSNVNHVEIFLDGRVWQKLSQRVDGGNQKGS